MDANRRADTPAASDLRDTAYCFAGMYYRSMCVRSLGKLPHACWDECMTFDSCVGDEVNKKQQACPPMSPWRVLGLGWIRW